MPKKACDCANCGGEKHVSVSIACPTCVAGGINELDALRNLAKFVKKNSDGRSKPHKTILALLQAVETSQGGRHA